MRDRFRLTFAVRSAAHVRSLMQRLQEDYGFDVSLKYEDSEQDLITLESQVGRPYARRNRCTHVAAAD